MNILTIDIGTTSMRGILYDAHGTALSSRAIQTPLAYRGKFIEHSPANVLAALTEICRVLSTKGRVDAVSVTAYRSAIALFEGPNAPLCDFIMWQDRRNAEICDRLREQNPFVYERSGASINTVFTATKLVWLKENRPEMYARAWKALTVADYAIACLTGNAVTDYTYGSRTHLMNLFSCQWDAELAALFQLDLEKLPDLIPQGSVAGRVTPAFSRTSGLPAGIPVVSAGGDQQCAALGLGVLDGESLEVNNGTGSFVMTLADAPQLENANVICNVGAIPGSYTLESNVLTSASALNWLMQNCLADLARDGKPDFDALGCLVRQAPVGSNGVVCLPLFQGTGTRDWNPEARAGFYGLTLNTTRGELARSLLEGIALEIHRSIRALPVETGKISRIYTGGGLTALEEFNQIQADVYGVEVVKYDDPQATSIGAFVACAVAMGLFKRHREALKAVRARRGCDVYRPNPENHAIYRRLERRGERLYRLLKRAFEGGV